MIGVAFYGRSFTLANQLNAKIGSLSIGPGLAGPITNRPGLLSFNEVNLKIVKKRNMIFLIS